MSEKVDWKISKLFISFEVSTEFNTQYVARLKKRLVDGGVWHAQRLTILAESSGLRMQTHSVLTVKCDG